ncbi:MAG: AhpC/TSA family protein [Flavobacteriaceae bacterium]|nr:AhpC/TSA family protein [Flavobacteriaceae bacterium]
MKRLLLISLLLIGCSNKTSIPLVAEDISPILIGETLPNAIFQNAEGKSVQLKAILEEKPTVLVFYRGGWCPYCNVQLSGLVEIEQDILELGYQIVAVSPDDYKNLQSTIENNSTKYKLLSDPNGRFIQEIGIAFKTSSSLREYITGKGQKGDTSKVMPAPTVMIVDKKGVIKFEYINPNYKERISGEMLLSVLRTIKG